MEHFIEWLKNLVSAGTQKAFAIALACVILIWIDQKGIFKLSSGIKETIVIFVVTSACVALVGFFSKVSSVIKPHMKKIIWEFRARVRVEKYLPRLTEKEKEILAYLLEKNQPMFTSDSDGEEARTLIAAGFVVCALRPGQMYVEGEVPYAIPEYVWSVLVKNKKNFPYTPANDDEPYPWRTPWMVKR